MKSNKTDLKQDLSPNIFVNRTNPTQKSRPIWTIASPSNTTYFRMSHTAGAQPPPPSELQRCFLSVSWTPTTLTVVHHQF